MFARRRSYTPKILLAVAIFGIFYWYISRPRLENLADYLPSEKTVVYAELPTELHPTSIAFIKEKTGIDLAISGDTQKNALAQTVSAITMVRLKEDTSALSHTFVVLQPRTDETQNTLIQHFSGAKITAGVVQASESSKPMIIAAQNAQDFQYAQSLFSAEYRAKKEPELSQNKKFLQARAQDREYPYFVYANPSLDQSLFVLPIQEQSSTLPLINSFDDTFEAHFDVHDGSISGELISTANTADSSVAPLSEQKEESYRALTLSLLPIDPDLFIGGTRITTILRETLHISPQLLQNIVTQYAPGISYETDIVPFLTGEFGFITSKRQNYTAGLLINNIDAVPTNADAQLEKIVTAFSRGASQLAFTTKPFVLRDGTQALERFPEPNGVTTKTEKIGDSTLYSVIYGQYDESTVQGLFVAMSHGKLFMSNDKNLIFQSLSLVREPGLSFRDGELYRVGLQPLLKNPQLTGLMHLDFGKNAKGLYSFSKRKFSDYTETQFQFVLE